MVTSSAASRTIFALAAIVGFSSGVIYWKRDDV